MGIQVEFNPDLALRNIKEYHHGKRSLEECIPEHLEKGRVYCFLKEGQRNYWLQGEIPLVETQGSGQLSKSLASVVILEATHFMNDRKCYTNGKYKVIDIFGDNDVHFDGFTRVK